MAESMDKPFDLNERLKDEQDVLESYFNSPGKYSIVYKDEDNEWYVEHEVKINEERKYKLRVYVSGRYPDVLPDLVVCESPEPMPEWGVSHETHTWGFKHGFLQICHWHWGAWKRENMIYQVFEKGEEWLAAYEKYLENEKLPLELKQMELTEEDQLYKQLQQVLKMFQLDFDVLYQLWHMSDKAREILCRCDLTRFPVDTEQRQLPGTESAIQRLNGDSSENLIAEFYQLQNAIKEYKAVWPPRLVALLTFLSQKLMMARGFIFFQREAQQRLLQLTQ